MRPNLAVTEFLYAHKYAEKSRRWYGGMLGNFADYCASQGIRDVGEITAPLSASTSMWSDSAAILVPASPSAAKRSTAMFALSKPCSIGACVRTCSARACHGAWRCLGASRRSSRPSPPARSTVLMGAAETIRDKAIVAVLLDTGLRARELCTLTIEHVHFAPPDDVRLLVRGKRDKGREVGLGKRARQLLHRYIHRERPRGAMPEERRVSLGRCGPLTPSGLD